MDIDNAPFSVGPRTVGHLLDATFRQYSAHFRYIFLASVAVLVPYFVLNALVTHQSYVDPQKVLTILAHARTLKDLEQLGNLGQNTVGPMDWLMSILESVLVSPLLYGTRLRFVVRNSLQGQEIPIDEAFSHAFRRLPHVVVTLILFAFIAIFGVMVIAIVLMALGALVGFVDNLSSVLGVVLALGLAIGSLIGALWLAVKFAFIPTVVIEENMSGWQPIRRSWALTKGNFWRSLWLFILVYLMVNVLRSLINLFASVVVHNTIVLFIISSIVTLFTIPFTMLATANLYVDLRVRNG